MTPEETVRGKVLIVDDEPDMQKMLGKVLGRKGGYEIRLARSGNEGLAMIGEEPWRPDVVITDIKMPGMDGMAFFRRLQEVDPTMTTIIMTGFGTVEMAVQALKEGAYDFFEKPFDNDKIIRAVGRAMERTALLRENRDLQSRLVNASSFCGFIGQSPRLVQIEELLRRLAPSSMTVLIRGESGTGKELAARALHLLSGRKGKRLITVNCPALPEHILESELFGYRKGAFTGADRDKEGLFVEADGSTILLDEIADIPVAVQTKLLRVLQEKEVQPLGQTKTFKVDVRVIASTNQDLEDKIRRGEFREDLFYRLNVVTVTMPSLAEIWEDIPLLAQHFLQRFTTEHKRENMEFTPEALQHLMHRQWKGNVRELQNTINRAVLLCTGNRIGVQDLAPQTSNLEAVRPDTGYERLCHLSYRDAKNEVLSDFTRTYLQAALRTAGGNISRAARDTGMERQALQRLLRRFRVYPGGPA